MNSIIDDLYLGNINPNELTRIVHRGHKKLAKEAMTLHEWLTSNLEGDSAEKFAQFVDKNGPMNAIEVRLRFIEGFRLGAQIMLDILTCPELDGTEED